MEPLHPRGFTLIELLVVLAIITIVMAIVFTGQSSFNKTLILENTAYDVALTFRVAETYGLNSRSVNTIPAMESVGYGIHFSESAPNSFILFNDTTGGPLCSSGEPDCNPGDHLYESGEMMQSYNLGNGMTISGFCAINSLTQSCSGVSGGLTSLDISFARPNPDTFIGAVSGAGSDTTSYNEACLVVSSPQNESRYVWVRPSGEISVNQTPCR